VIQFPQSGPEAITVTIDFVGQHRSCGNAAGDHCLQQGQRDLRLGFKRYIIRHPQLDSAPVRPSSFLADKVWNTVCN